MPGRQVVYAQWSPNVAVSIGGGQHPGIASDGAGGFIVAWFTGSTIGAQRINSAGVAQWTAGGVTIGSGLGQQVPVSMVADGAGGAIITWISSGFDIYIQRVNASGVLQWTAGGVPICTALNNQLDPSIVSDGAGGAIITWYDYRAGTGIYAQHVDASGAVQWTANGTAICTATSTGSNNRYGPRIISDDAGGAIITWKDNRNGNIDIYAQRVNASGIMQWTIEGIAICTLAGDQDEPDIASDEAGGAIITWQGGGIYAQRVDASGLMQWAAGGIPVCTATGSHVSPAIVNNEAGGVIIAWRDTRNGNADIYAQRINTFGAGQWITDGIAICTATNSQEIHAITGNGAGGAIITWMDFRNGTAYDIYAQQVAGSGVIQWIADGVAVCTTAGNQGYPVILGNASGGAFVVWNNSPPPPISGVFIQNVNADGTIGPAAIPVITCPAGNNSITSPLTGATYQWQLNTGSGFTNITDNSNYTGTNTVSLQLNSVPSAWYGYLYRCLVSGTYINTYKLVFSNTWGGATDTDWENPANWSCGSKPDEHTDVVINSGTVVVTANTTIRTLSIAPGVNFSVAPGIQLIITH